VSNTNDSECSECGGKGGQHDRECPLQVATVTDRRGVRDPNAVYEETPSDEEQVERDRILAEQAAAMDELPYTGAGVVAETDEDALEPCLTAFVVIVHNDGTGHAFSDLNILDKYEPFMPAAPKQMYRACAEIMMDVQAAETAQATLKALEIRTVAAAQAAHTGARGAVQDALRKQKK
jgi:hypothetical protein